MGGFVSGGNPSNISSGYEANIGRLTGIACDGFPCYNGRVGRLAQGGSTGRGPEGLGQTETLVAQKANLPRSLQNKRRQIVATIHMVRDDTFFVCGRTKGEFTQDIMAVTCKRCVTITEMKAKVVNGEIREAFIDEIVTEPSPGIHVVDNGKGDVEQVIGPPSDLIPPSPDFPVATVIPSVAPKRAAKAVAEKIVRKPDPVKKTNVHQMTKPLGGNKCLCGCGGSPKSRKGRYLPGHDAKHHAALKAKLEKKETKVK